MGRGEEGDEWRRTAIYRREVGRVGRRASEIRGGERIEELECERV